MIKMRAKFCFKSSKGHKLCGILSAPDESKKTFIVVAAHGWTSGKDRKTYLLLEKTLLESRIGIFRFDMYGHGESEGQLEDMTATEGIDDVLSAIKFVRQKGYKNIGLFGSSFGGLCAVIAASKTNAFALALKSPVSEYKGVVLRKNVPDFMKNARKYSAYHVAQKIKCPVFLVHGQADDVVPVEQSRKLAKMLKNCTYVEVKGMKHTQSKKQVAQAVKNAAGFFVGTMNNS